MSNTLSPERITSLGDRFAGRMDRLKEAMPSVAPARQLPPEQYLPMALARAERDPEFKRRLQDALRQYQRVGGTNG